MHLPHDVEDTIPNVQLAIDNVDRAIIADIRSISGPADVEIKIVLQSDPNTIEVGPFDFKVRTADHTALQITASLQYEDILNETFPDQSYTVLTFPGLFP